LWKKRINLDSSFGSVLFRHAILAANRRNIFVTSADIAILVEKAKRITMSSSEREQQRRSFAYGNANIENEAVTKDVIEEVADKMIQDPGIEDVTSE
jgi:hypothetical protein